MKRFVKLVALCAVMALVTTSLTGCFFIRPYPTPHIIEVTPSQSLVVVPLSGKSSDQAMAPTEAFYKKNLVYDKRYYVPQVWITNGPFRDSGYFADGERAILVERKPVVRVWTKTPDTGTSASDQAIEAESRESISFYTQMNCTVQLQDSLVPKFLANYNNKPLDQVMDNDVRAYVAGQFTQQCAKYSMDQILASKGDIMSVVTSNTVDHFANLGVSVTNLSIEGDFTYKNQKIQDAIDLVFQADRDKKAQELTNQKQLETAQTQAQAAKALASNPIGLQLKQIELKNRELDNDAAWIAKWNGTPPTYMGQGGSLFQFPAK